MKGVYTPTEGFGFVCVSKQRDVDEWFKATEEHFKRICSKYEESDIDVLQNSAIEVSDYLYAFQRVRDQLLNMKFRVPELVKGLRYSAIVGETLR